MITVVTGLPRSGTSMMMQMLQAGGLPLLTDHHRAPDESNPRGYFELEQVKQIKRDASWLAHADGKVVKIISQLLGELPSNYEYRMIFMRRDLDEVILSQAAMLERAGKNAAPADSLRKAFEAHLRQVVPWLQAQPNMTYLEVDHRHCMEDSEETARSICDFLGVEMDTTRMAQAVDDSLFRVRAEHKA